MTDPLISVVINYYNPQDNPRVSAMVLFALECLAAYTESPHELILVDGSGKRSDDVAARCGARGWSYEECPDKGNFAHIYNQGMRSARGRYLVWMASDIFVCSGWDKKLIAEIERTRAFMAAPYLTNSDYLTQTRNYPLKMWTFVPSSMTFNLNMITRECLEKVGYMDDRFTGNFNDMDYLLRIRAVGGEAIVVNAGQVLHMARATSSVMSTFKFDEDLRQFLLKYPELRLGTGDVLNQAHPKLTQYRLQRWLTRLCYLAPGSWKLRLHHQFMRWEPLFAAI